jgi:hypothetical protein
MPFHPIQDATADFPIAGYTGESFLIQADSMPSLVPAPGISGRVEIRSNGVLRQARAAQADTI